MFVGGDQVVDSVGRYRVLAWRNCYDGGHILKLQKRTLFFWRTLDHFCCDERKKALERMKELYERSWQ